MIDHLERLLIYTGVWPIHLVWLAVTAAELTCLAFLFGYAGLYGLLPGFLLTMLGWLRGYSTRSAAPGHQS